MTHDFSLRNDITNFRNKALQINEFNQQIEILSLMSHAYHRSIIMSSRLIVEQMFRYPLVKYLTIHKIGVIFLLSALPYYFYRNITGYLNTWDSQYLIIRTQNESL
jgi:hypothetical protein